MRIMRYGFIVILLFCLSVRAVRAEEDIFVDAELLSDLAMRGQTLLDVRPAEVFAAYHIPGSLNIPAFEIKAKSFLEFKPIVLVGETLGLCNLLTIRENLMANGFQQVTILKGGITAWSRNERYNPPSGIPKFLLKAALDCAQLTPVLIDLRTQNKFAERTLAGAINVPVSNPNTDAAALFNNISPLLPPQAGTDPFSPLIFIDDSGANAQRPIAIFRENGRVFSFFLENGLDDWFLTEDNPPGLETLEGGAPGDPHGCPTCPGSR